MELTYGSNVSYASTQSETASTASAGSFGSRDLIAPNASPVYRGGSLPWDLRNTPARQQRAATAAQQGQFELLELEQLGEGGFGKVLRARHRISGEVVAAKVIADGARSEVRLAGRRVMLPAHCNWGLIVLASFVAGTPSC